MMMIGLFTPTPAPTICSAGPPQVLSELFKTSSGAAFNSVPYRQTPQLIADLLGDRIQVYFGAGAGLVSLVQQRKVKALAYTGVTRYPALPQVPTVIEEGLPQRTRVEPRRLDGDRGAHGYPGKCDQHTQCRNKFKSQIAGDLGKHRPARRRGAGCLTAGICAIPRRRSEEVATAGKSRRIEA